MKKILTTKRFLILITILVAIGLIGSCVFGSPEQKEYELDTVSTQTVQSIVSVVGSVKPEKETTLSFQRGGVVETLYVKEGDSVLSGQLLAELDRSTFALDVESKQAMLELERIGLRKLQNGLTDVDEALLNTTLANARLSLTAMSKSIAATRDKNARQVAEAELQVENAKSLWESTKNTSTTTTDVDLSSAQTAVENAQRALTLAIKSNEESVKAAEQRVREAEVALRNAETDLSTGQPIQDKNIENAQVKAFYDAAVYLDGVDKALRAVNDIITVEDYNKDANAPYRELLGVKKLNSYTDVTFAYDALKYDYRDQRELFNITSEVLSYDEIIRRIVILKGLLDDSFSLLTKASVLLDNSLTSSSFPVSELNRLKTGVLTQRDAVAASLTGTVTTKQTVENLELQKTSTVSSLEGRVASAKVSLETAKQSLSTTRVQAEVSLEQAKTGVTQADDALEKVKASSGVKDIDVDRTYNAYREAEERLATTRASIIEQEASLDKTRIDLESQVRSAEAQRDAQVASARPEDIAVQEERIRQAEIAVELAQKSLDDVVIRSPKSGVITQVSVSLGENASPGAAAVQMIGDTVSVIEANIAETEIASVSLGQRVQIDFDAFERDDVYEGTVTFINPDKTSLDGVIYYGIEVSFDARQLPEREVRPGFTANLEIITQEITTIAVPVSALKEDEEGMEYVEVPVQQGTVQTEEKRYVETGLEGDEYIEIRSGLEEGEQIILSIMTKE